MLDDILALFRRRRAPVRRRQPVAASGPRMNLATIDDRMPSARTSDYMPSAELGKYLKSQHSILKDVLGELGMLKQ